MAGRKPKLTPQRQELIVTLLRQGQFVCVACQKAKIDDSTFFAWMAKGERAAGGIYREFHDAVKEAEADFQILAVGDIKTAAKGTPDKPAQWQALAWLLERRHPKLWGRKRIEIVGDDGGPVQTELSTAPDMAPVNVKITVSGPGATATPDFGPIVDETGGG